MFQETLFANDNYDIYILYIIIIKMKIQNVECHPHVLKRRKRRLPPASPTDP